MVRLLSSLTIDFYSDEAWLDIFYHYNKEINKESMQSRHYDYTVHGLNLSLRCLGSDDAPVVISLFIILI